MPPQLISGDIHALDPAEFKTALTNAGITRLDTAARYTNGESEKKLGREKFPQSFTIDTKILFTGKPGSLAPDAIRKSLDNSLQVLGVGQVNVLYCHAPDGATPIADQARTFDEEFRKGRFTHLGVSNFPPSMLEEWLAVADREGYVKPSVYEGQYNLLCRVYECSLFPLLRANGIAFNGYSPLAGGFLLGNLTPDGVKSGTTRFTQPGPYREWYDRPGMHEAVRKLRTLAERTGLGMDELSLRWIVHHSALRDADGVIMGAGKPVQMETNAAQVHRGPLEKDVVEELNALSDGASADGASIIEKLDAMARV